ncbi:MAG: rhodanese-like domain-containing protein [Clostridia bacterium]|nr:rhodanese-like domain-containing protein [Clostridia bacterium]
MKRVIIIILLLALLTTACSPSPQGTEEPLSYEMITAAEAKEIMDTHEEYILIDARTQEEFAQGHIRGAVLIPEYEIASRAPRELPDKNALILVYCRSGRRSKIAAQELVRLGYSNVKEFGGIIDWPYEIVK